MTHTEIPAIGGLVAEVLESIKFEYFPSLSGSFS